jgi:hypothetical protein
MIAGMGTLGTRPGFPVAGDGYWAEVQSGDQYLRLFSEVYSLGYLAVVFDVNRKAKVVREDADNLDEAKKQAEGLAAGYRSIAALERSPKSSGNSMRKAKPFSKGAHPKRKRKRLQLQYH